MGKHRPQAVAPRYMASFECLGSQCPETCCSGWTVAVDKPTYQKYRTVKIEPIGSQLRQAVVKVPKPTTRHYATLRYDAATGFCGFLADGWCGVQKELGAEYLSATCRDYPRLYQAEGDGLSMYGTLSCPQTARLALTDVQALDAETVELPFANASLVPVVTRQPKPSPSETDPFRKHPAVVRTVMEALVRDDGFSASEALVACGLMLRAALQAVQAAASPVAAEYALMQTLERFLSPIARQTLPAEIRSLPENKTLQFDLLTSASAGFFGDYGGRTSFRLLMADVLKGLDWQDDALEVNVGRYAAIEREVFRPFDAAHPHVLKNYLLNDLGKSMFPRHGAALVEKEFMSLAVRFGLIRLYAIGLAGLRREAFGVDDMVRVIYTFARNVEHNLQFIPKVLHALESKGALQVAMLAMLVR